MHGKLPSVFQTVFVCLFAYILFTSSVCVENGWASPALAAANSNVAEVNSKNKIGMPLKGANITINEVTQLMRASFFERANLEILPALINSYANDIAEKLFGRRHIKNKDGKDITSRALIVLALFIVLIIVTLTVYYYWLKKNVISTEPDLSLTGTPAIFFAYPHETPVIKDKTKVATIVFNHLYRVHKVDNFTVDNIFIFRKRGPKNMRATVKHSKGRTVAIDVLPGKHTFVITYSENLSADRGKLLEIGYRGQDKLYAKIEAKINFEQQEFHAGHFYQLKAIITNGNLSDFKIDKGLSDDSYGQKIIEERNKAPY